MHCGLFWGVRCVAMLRAFPPHATSFRPRAPSLRTWAGGHRSSVVRAKRSSPASCGGLRSASSSGPGAFLQSLPVERTIASCRRVPPAFVCKGNFGAKEGDKAAVGAWQGVWLPVVETQSRGVTGLQPRLKGKFGRTLLSWGFGKLCRWLCSWAVVWAWLLVSTFAEGWFAFCVGPRTSLRRNCKRQPAASKPLGGRYWCFWRRRLRHAQFSLTSQQGSSPFCPVLPG